MVDSISKPLMQDAAEHRNRSNRHPANIDAYVEGDGEGSHSRLQNISLTGAAIIGVVPNMTNGEFLNLHIEGYEKMQGRIVREFPDGYAIEFTEDNSHMISEEELAAFRKLTRING